MQETDLEGQQEQQDQEAAQAVPRGHVLLVLDSALQSLPWESLPGLRQQRCVSLLALLCICEPLPVC